MLKRCLALPPVARSCQTQTKKSPQLRGLSGISCHQVPGCARRGIIPKSLELYSTAIHKYKHRIFSRNLIDDLRLSLELLLKSIFKNDKSLENQMSALGLFVESAGGSVQFSNMFMKLIDYYTKYQNTYIKHDDAVNEDETEFVFELTSSFMRYVIRLNTKISGSQGFNDYGF